MKCSYCGVELNPGQRFCHRCGTQLMAAVAAKPAEPVQVAAAEPVAVAVEPDIPARPVYQIPQPVFEPPQYVPPEPAPAYEPPKFEYTLPQSHFQPPDLNKPFTVPTFESVPFDNQNAAPVPEVQPAPEVSPAPVFQSQSEVPHIQLPTGRSWAKMVFLGLITLGIYPFVIWNKIVTELNIVASRHDGERTTNFLAAGMLSVITLGVYAFVWIHGFCRRIGAELQRRSIPYRFGAAAFWKWNFLSLIIVALVVTLIFLLAIPYAQWIAIALAVLYLICPFIFLHKLMKSMNLMNQHFNQNG